MQRDKVSLDIHLLAEGRKSWRRGEFNRSWYSCSWDCWESWSGAGAVQHI